MTVAQCVKVEPVTGTQGGGDAVVIVCVVIQYFLFKHRLATLDAVDVSVDVRRVP